MERWIIEKEKIVERSKRNSNSELKIAKIFFFLFLFSMEIDVIDRAAGKPG